MTNGKKSFLLTLVHPVVSPHTLKTQKRPATYVESESDEESTDLPLTSLTCMRLSHAFKMSITFGAQRTYL